MLSLKGLVGMSGPNPGSGAKIFMIEEYKNIILTKVCEEGKHNELIKLYMSAGIEFNVVATEAEMKFVITSVYCAN